MITTRYIKSQWLKAAEERKILRSRLTRARLAEDHTLVQILEKVYAAACDRRNALNAKLQVFEELPTTSSESVRSGRNAGPTLTGEQIVEARKLLGWSASRLAARACISPPTLQKAEQKGTEDLRSDKAKQLRLALKLAGIEFIDGEIPSVRIRKLS